MKLALLAVLAVAVMYGLHGLGVWAERRGWIYYRKRHGSSGTLSNTFLEVHSLFDPSKRYVLEEKTRAKVEDEESGDPPATRDGRRQSSGRRRVRSGSSLTMLLLAVGCSADSPHVLYHNRLDSLNGIISTTGLTLDTATSRGVAVRIHSLGPTTIRLARVRTG